jgi:hypothetical protein
MITELYKVLKYRPEEGVFTPRVRVGKIFPKDESIFQKKLGLLIMKDQKIGRSKLFLYHKSISWTHYKMGVTTNLCN